MTDRKGAEPRKEGKRPSLTVTPPNPLVALHSLGIPVSVGEPARELGQSQPDTVAVRQFTEPTGETFVSLTYGNPVRGNDASKGVYFAGFISQKGIVKSGEFFGNSGTCQFSFYISEGSLTTDCSDDNASFLSVTGADRFFESQRYQHGIDAAINAVIYLVESERGNDPVHAIALAQTFRILDSLGLANHERCNKVAAAYKLVNRNKSTALTPFYKEKTNSGITMEVGILSPITSEHTEPGAFVSFVNPHTEEKLTVFMGDTSLPEDRKRWQMFLTTYTFPIMISRGESNQKYAVAMPQGAISLGRVVRHTYHIPEKSDDPYLTELHKIAEQFIDEGHLHIP